MASNTDEKLRSLVERVERLLQEKANLAEDIKEVLSEAKGNGYDVKTLRRIITLRAADRDKVNEQAALLQTYASARGEQ